MIELRDYQAELLAAVRQAFAVGFWSLLVTGPTGCGKTFMFAFMILRAVARGKRVLVLVHRKELLDQTSRALAMLGVAHGVIAPGRSWMPEAVQVASVCTLVNRLTRLGAWHPDLIVVDEAHHVTPGSVWGRVLAWWGALPGEFSGHRARVTGWTATPERLDGQGLGKINGGAFEILVEGPQAYDLILRGALARPVVFKGEEVDMTGVPIRAGDYAPAAAAARVNTPKIAGHAVAEYRQRVQGAPALAFCHNLQHAEQVAAEFRAAGYQSTSIDGKLSDRDRRARIEDLGAGRLNVLTSCQIVSEGTDIPVVAAAILLRRTESLALYLQQVGRALRPYTGKTCAWVLDHVGNSLPHRHGLPDLDREWSLDVPARKRRKRSEHELREPQSVTCPACGISYRVAPRCPVCGHGEQLDLGWDINERLVQAESVEEQYARYVASGGWSMRRRTLEEWRQEAVRRGYRPGWGDHRFEWQEKKIGGDGRRAA